MIEYAPHIPGPAVTPDPPPGLESLAQSLRDSSIAQVGLTTLANGHWALFVRVRRGATPPIEAVEEARGEFPVVYDMEQEHLPVARPAYPSRGE